jgi:hypothetical protein
MVIDIFELRLAGKNEWIRCWLVRGVRVGAVIRGVLRLVERIW